MRKELRRGEILRVAAAVFAAKGYHEAKVDDIAAAAKVAKGTLYLYFDDKRAIFSELIDTLFTRLLGAIVQVDTEGDVGAQIKHNIRAVIGVLVEEPDIMRMLFDQASSVDREFRVKIGSFYRGLKLQLTTSLKDGQKLGLVKKGDAGLYASLTVGALREILVEATTRPEGQRTREQVVEAVFEVLQGGYLRLDKRKDLRARRVVAVIKEPRQGATAPAAEKTDPPVSESGEGARMTRQSVKRAPAATRPAETRAR